jgi:SAM-dependent methyltransferase
MNQGTSNYQKFLKKKAKAQAKANANANIQANVNTKAKAKAKANINTKKSLFKNKNNKIIYNKQIYVDRGSNILIELKKLKISNGKSESQSDVQPKASLGKSQSQSDVQPKASLGKIIELGCNSGKNLEILRKQGYKDLTGIDVNKYAFEHMKKVYPELYKITTKKIGLIENITDTMDNIYDLSFTIAVLIHIDSKERSKIYKWLSGHSRYIIFIEKNFGGIKLNEGEIYNNIYPRDELEKLGFKLVKFSNLHHINGLNKFKILVMKNTKNL